MIRKRGVFLRLWTIQPVEVYEKILQTGYYKCDGRYTWKYFREAYRWLCKEMVQKVGKPPKGIKYPVWAWYKYDNKQKKPDLRHAGFATKGERCVCIEIEIPDSEVLLSDYDAWHFVLNNWYFNVDCEDELTWDKDSAWLKTLSAEEKERAIQASWQGIFRIDEHESDWQRRGHWVQATFWVLRKENIKKVQYFTAR